MALRVTVDMFSGRRNPVIEVKGKEAEDLLARLKPARKLTAGEAQAATPSWLGYRGLIVEQVGARKKAFPKTFRAVAGRVLGQDLAHLATDEDFEQALLSSKSILRGLKSIKNVSRMLDSQIPRARQIVEMPRPKLGPILRKPVCPCAPIYEPSWWNDGGQIQGNNNCYNYASNYRSDTFAQSGEAAGAIYGALTCAAVRPAAIADSLIDSPAANNKCPKTGHLVALVIAPGSDFHWYRKGPNGRWTHKPGGTQATNLDNSGNIITDPRTADRGPYTDFCTFMVVMHGHIKIR